MPPQDPISSFVSTWMAASFATPKRPAAQGQASIVVYPPVSSNMACWKIHFYFDDSPIIETLMNRLWISQLATFDDRRVCEHEDQRLFRSWLYGNSSSSVKCNDICRCRCELQAKRSYQPSVVEHSQVSWGWIDRTTHSYPPSTASICSEMMNMVKLCVCTYIH